MAEHKHVPDQVPASVCIAALRLAMRMHCRFTTDSCIVPAHKQRFLQIYQRHIHDWERKRILKLHTRIGPHLIINAGIRNSMIQRVMRDSAHRYSEPAGFEMDHPNDASQWRRFK